MPNCIENTSGVIKKTPDWIETLQVWQKHQILYTPYVSPDCIENTSGVTGTSATATPASLFIQEMRWESVLACSFSRGHPIRIFGKKLGFCPNWPDFLGGWEQCPILLLPPNYRYQYICQLFWNTQVGEYSQDCPRGYSWNLYRRRCVLKFTSGWSYDECIFGKVNLRCVIIGSLVCTQKCLPRL